MTLKELLEKLEDNGLPVAFQAFEGDVPPLPYVYYSTPGITPFYADGEVYFCGSTVELQVCSLKKSILLELKMHNVLRGVKYTRAEERNESENRYEYTYTLEVL